jgi:hypothetical protein
MPSALIVAMNPLVLDQLINLPISKNHKNLFLKIFDEIFVRRVEHCLHLIVFCGKLHNNGHHDIQRYGTQHNDTLYNGIHHKDTQHYHTLHNDKHNKDTQQIGTKHNDIQLKGTRHNGTKHSDIQYVISE